MFGHSPVPRKRKKKKLNIVVSIEGYKHRNKTKIHSISQHLLDIKPSEWNYAKLPGSVNKMISVPKVAKISEEQKKDFINIIEDEITKIDNNCIVEVKFLKAVEGNKHKSKIFPSFCNACGGFKGHKLMCPIGDKK